ncbi:MAG: hypothetical protein M3Z29_09455 [Pseudomonadota bacterium]|nr:hypothetical protein [Pseudomonadota bacterium]
MSQTLSDVLLELRVLLCTGPGLAPELKDARRKQALALLDVAHNLPLYLGGTEGEPRDLSADVDEAQGYGERFGNGAHAANLLALQAGLMQRCR